MRVHELKCYPEYYQVIKRGIKTFEKRMNDRGFQVDDVLHLCEFDGLGYTGNSCRVKVTYVLDESSGFVEPGFVIMSIVLL